MEITVEQLKNAAEDMNKIMDLDPPIDTSVPLDELLAQFEEAVEYVDPADVFQEETWDIINARIDGLLRIAERDVKEKRDGKSESENKGSGGKGRNKKSKKSGSGRTRASVMADILAGTRTNPLTKGGMVEKMIDEYKGSEAEAKFQVNVYVRLLMALGLLEVVDEDGRMKYIG